MTNPYLKDRYQKHLWVFIGLNLGVFWFLLVSGGNVLGLLDRLSDVSLTTGVLALLSPIVVIVLNGLLTPLAKARLVFLRWHHPLPGSRAFSRYAHLDHRIDLSRLPESPSTPEEENRVWYRLFKQVEEQPSVAGAHHAYLFTRDISGLAFLFLMAFGPIAIATSPDTRVALGYAVCLVVQYALAALAAGNYGRRFVTNVLALSSS